MWFLLRLPLALLLVTMTLPSISTARPSSTTMLLLATTITATVNAAASSSASSVVAIAACDGRSDKKELQDMTTALLHAHRCMLKDVPVAVPLPANTIPDLIVPSHIIVQRCSGLCLNSLGSECRPKRTKVEEHNIVVYVNATPYCTTIELEHHRGPCRCECGQTSCSSPRHQFQAESCSCSCLPSLTKEKQACSNTTSREWDSSSCSCKCRSSPLECAPGLHWDSSTCLCVASQGDQEAGCLGSDAQGGSESSLPALNLYPVLVIVMAVILFLLLITSLSFTLSARWQSKNAQHRHLVEPTQLQPKAYTITLCSNQSLDKAP